MRRILGVVLVVTIWCTGAVAPLTAQDAPVLEDGTKADRETSREVIAAAKSWIALANDGDPAALDGLTETLRTGMRIESLDQLLFAPFEIIRTRDVRILTDGRFTLEITFSGGFGLEHQYANQRWVFVRTGDAYLLDLYVPSQRSPYIPEEWTQGQIDARVDDGAIALEDGGSTVEMVTPDLLFISLRQDAPVPVGLYRLHEDADPAAPAAKVVDLIGVLQAGASDDPGNGFVGLGPGTYVVSVGEVGLAGMAPAVGTVPIVVTLTDPTGISSVSEATPESD